MFPALSPDGTTLAVQHNGMRGRILETQMHLIDLATNKARPIGEPHDMAFASWLPDGSGLVLTVRRPGATPDTTIEGIARMDLDGRVTPIRDGDMPTLVGDGRTILYRDHDSRLWRTCGLDGKDDKPYADGLPGYAFPALSPDGRRLVMMGVGPGQAPMPTLFKLGESAGRPLTKGPGLWGWPAWRVGVRGGRDFDLANPRIRADDHTPGPDVNRRLEPLRRSRELDRWIARRDAQAYPATVRSARSRRGRIAGRRRQP